MFRALVLHKLFTLSLPFYSTFFLSLIISDNCLLLMIVQKTKSMSFYDVYEQQKQLRMTSNSGSFWIRDDNFFRCSS